MKKLCALLITLPMVGCQLTSQTTDVAKVSQTRKAEHATGVSTLSDHLDQYFTQSGRESMLSASVRLLESANTTTRKGRDRQTNARWELTVGGTDWQAVEVKRPTVEQVEPNQNFVFMDMPYRANTRVNLRSGPSTKHTRLRQLKKGEVFNVMAQVISQPWVLVEQGGTVQGYVHQNYVTANVTKRDLLSTQPNPIVSPVGNPLALPELGYVGILTCRPLAYKFSNDTSVEEGKFLACQKQTGVWYIDSWLPLEAKG
ncbi:SH3 domain-containing protein [Thaumasiovibrio subtropicus]|uniref:SH3 domain-containing protein n=1 Tax=Thaumasiovibrio subtropicus TaxID=1891207 RepID=UPI000B35E122|nr:SH3 domain-containing protein [Thaumasiovibrio subtropicus]